LKRPPGNIWRIKALTNFPCALFPPQRKRQLGTPGDQAAAVVAYFAEAINEAQRRGIALAKAKDGETEYRGRKLRFTRAQFIAARDMIAQSAGIGQIAKITGISRRTIYRIENDPVAA
jgi:DNA invertase Pin-like site-specific DNA recombinase